MSFYTEEKERSHRFILALRMGLPIFLLSVVSFFILFLDPDATVSTLIFLIFILLGIAVYFIFFLINQSTYETITDSITHTFTAEYFFKIFTQWNRRRTNTVTMISITNLARINEQYGIRNGDKILIETTRILNEYFGAKEIKTLPISRYKGGDFLILFKGEKEPYAPMIELFLTKYQECRINEIEVQFSAVYVDTRYMKKAEEIINRLYEILYATKENISMVEDDQTIPSELEHSIVDALESQRFSIATQKIVSDTAAIEEVSIKLIDQTKKLIHQSRFIPLLNRIGKMGEYEKEVLKRVIVLASKSSSEYMISLSSALLRNGLFFQYALELLQRYPNAKERVIIMIDEKEYAPQIKRFREQISQYRSVGYKIGLDRYGVNLNTMMYLKEFDVDYVRFDPLYTRHIKEEKYQNILQGLNITAHLCGASTWMSMIEDKESDTIATRLKINVRQGNFHAKITPIMPDKEQE